MNYKFSFNYKLVVPHLCVIIRYIIILYFIVSYSSMSRMIFMYNNSVDEFVRMSFFYNFYCILYVTVFYKWAKLPQRACFVISDMILTLIGYRYLQLGVLMTHIK